MTDLPPRSVVRGAARVRPVRPPVDPPRAEGSHGSVRVVRPGTVVVEHLSTTGRDDRVERPVSDAVPLFWRFVTEKFGIAGR